MDTDPYSTTRPDAPDESSGGRATEARRAAAEESKQVAGTTADQTKQVTGTAAEGARQVTGEAREQAKQVAQEASRQARDLAYQARDQIRTQAESQAQRAAQGLRTLGDQARALAEGRTDAAGPTVEYLNRFADRLGDISSHVEERGLQGVVSDVEDFARRRPVLFLGLAAAAGFAVSRLARAAQRANDETSDRRFARTPEYSDTPTVIIDETAVTPTAGIETVANAPIGTPDLGPGPVGPLSVPDLETVRREGAETRSRGGFAETPSEPLQRPREG